MNSRATYAVAVDEQETAERLGAVGDATQAGADRVGAALAVVAYANVQASGVMWLPRRVFISWGVRSTASSLGIAQ